MWKLCATSEYEYDELKSETDIDDDSRADVNYEICEHDTRRQAFSVSFLVFTLFGLNTVWFRRPELFWHYQRPPPDISGAFARSRMSIPLRKFVLH